MRTARIFPMIVPMMTLAIGLTAFGCGAQNLTAQDPLRSIADIQQTQTDPQTDTETNTDPDTSNPPPPGADPIPSGQKFSFEAMVDLDGNQSNESHLVLFRCGNDSKGYCLGIESPLANVGTRTIRITADGKKRDENSMAGIDAKSIGYHDAKAIGNYDAKSIGYHDAKAIGGPKSNGGPKISQIAVLYIEGRQTPSLPALAIVDLVKGKVIAKTVAPATQTTSFTSYPTDPTGKSHPFLAPSFGDAAVIDPSLSKAEQTWGYLCVYRPEAALPAGRCGAGFAEISTVPAGIKDWFREAAGYLQDLDSDGWQDIQLVYHSTILSLSVSQLRQIGQTTYDIAAATEPGSPKNFHSGRQYGTHAPITLPDGNPGVVMVGGVAAGAFDDPACNVSRFVGLLKSQSGNPASRHLEYSHYYGFGSAIFSRFDPAFATHPQDLVSRPGDLMNGCIHRYDNSLSQMDDRPVILFNTFVQEASTDVCLKAQFDIYLSPAWTPEKIERYKKCETRNVGLKGVWQIKIHDLLSGNIVSGSSGTYAWGWTNKIAPSGATLYLIEETGKSSRFDLADRELRPILVRELVNGGWKARGKLPLPGRPKLKKVDFSPRVGTGKGGSIVKLSLQDIDGDGLLDIEMEDGTWVGYSPTAPGSFSVKLRPAP